jgi:hypothetical protein
VKRDFYVNCAGSEIFGGNRHVPILFEYGLNVHKWLRQHTDLAELFSEEPPRKSASPATVQREDALAVVSWYCLQIGVKLARSLSGAMDYEEETRWEADADDSGTARIIVAPPHT